MVRSGDVDHIGLEARHMTRRAVIFGTLKAAHPQRQAARALLLVTAQAALAKIGRDLLRSRLFVWVVARDAPKPAVTGAKALASIHLLDLADGLLVGFVAGTPDKYRPE